MTEINTY